MDYIDFLNVWHIFTVFGKSLLRYVSIARKDWRACLIFGGNISELWSGFVPTIEISSRKNGIHFWALSFIFSSQQFCRTSHNVASWSVLSSLKPTTKIPSAIRKSLSWLLMIWSNFLLIGLMRSEKISAMTTPKRPGAHIWQID